MVEQQLAAPVERTLPIWRQMRWGLIISFVSIAVVPLVIVTAAILSRVQEQTVAQMTSQLESVADLKTALLHRWVDDAIFGMRLFRVPGTDAQLARLLAGDASADEQAEVDRLMAKAISAQATSESDALHFERFFVYNLDGQIMAASDPAMVGRVVARQPYFQASLQDVIIQAPFYAVSNQELTMVIAMPVADEAGRVVGALAAEPDLGLLSQIMLDRSGLGETGETYLVSLESNYMLTPSRFEGYQQNRAYYSDGITRALGGESGSGIYGDYRSPSVPVIGVYRWVPELNAALLAEIDRSEALSIYDDTARLVILLALAAACGAAAAGFYTATRFSRPITALTRASTRLAEGSLDERAAVSDRSEIGVLAAAFNSMADRLQETMSGLEHRVAERTADLERTSSEARRALAELQESLHERDQLSASMRELSSPVVPVVEGVLVLPLIGAIDSQRAALLTSTLLERIEHYRAKIAIIDVTGVPVIDTQVARVLLDAATAARLVGAQPILVGVRPEMAQTMVSLGLDLSELTTLADLQSGVRYALAQQARSAGLKRIV